MTNPIVIERVYDAPVDKVWKAITSKEQMKEWYFELSAFEAKPGFEFSFEGGKDDKTYLHLCKVKEVIEGKKLSYTWRYQGYSGDSLVTFELFPEGNKTRLKLTHEGLETLQPGHADFAKENFVQGWTHIIGKSLPEYLARG